MDKRQTASEIEEQAARWVVRLDRDGRTAQMQAELDSWLAGDPRRAGALLQAEAAWALLDRGELLRARCAARPVQRPTYGRGVAIGVLVALAASLAAVSLFWRPTWLHSDSTETTQTQHYASERGEVRQVAFADGSSATMNALTRLEVAYSPNLRAVTLSKGEAWFDVAKNPERPFVVNAGGANVKAVGTSFAVQYDRDVVDIRVTEGVVEVWATGQEAAKVRIGAGAVAQVGQGHVHALGERGRDEIDRDLQWRTGKIDLRGQTLAQAVEQFNRHADRKLVIVDPRLAGEQLHGTFLLRDAESFARAVQTSLGVPVDLSQSDRIQIGTVPAEDRTR